MAATDRSTVPTTDHLAGQLREAAFVRLVAADDGDSVAAAALLAGTLDEAGVPYQLSVTPVTDRFECQTEADLRVAIGRSVDATAETIGLDGPATETAHAVATEFGVNRLDLALAGAVAATGHPGSDLSTAAAEAGIERRPGVGVPTADLATGLAYSTLVVAPFSGDVDAAESAVHEAGIDHGSDATTDERRKLASQVALAVAGDDAGTARGAERIERFLRPLVGGPFETIPGYADVLETLAAEQPGLALAAALQRADRESVLDAWCGHAASAHGAVRTARYSRHDGFTVVRCDGTPPVDTVARLVLSYRTPEPLVLVVGDGVAAARSTGDTAVEVGSLVAQTLSEFDGKAGGTPNRGSASFDADPTELVAAFKEAV